MSGVGSTTLIRYGSMMVTGATPARWPSRAAVRLRTSHRQVTACALDERVAGDQRTRRERPRPPDQPAEPGDALRRDPRGGAGGQRRLGSRESVVAEVDLHPRPAPGAPQIQRKDVEAVDLPVTRHP